MEANDIRRICFEVRRLADKANWVFTGLPIISWEFATIADFANARRDLLSALTLDLAPLNPERLLSGEIAEIECNGVLFRLSCAQKLMTREGPRGATEVPVVFRDDIDVP